jgi:transposase
MVHLLRDLHELKEKSSEDLETVKWAQAVRALYDEARESLARDRGQDQETRERQYVRLVGRMHELGLRHAQDKGHPCWALCKRVLRHEDELFQFVLIERLSPSNNQAERSIRPLVVVRKISGGSRSPSGSQTRMALASLFGTWQARQLNPFTECLCLLSQPLPRPTQLPLPQP